MDVERLVRWGASVLIFSAHKGCCVVGRAVSPAVFLRIFAVIKHVYENCLTTNAGYRTSIRMNATSF
jgi:hypothetical protein